MGNMIATQQFLHAAHDGDLDKVKECIVNGMNKDATDNVGSTALHYASHHGHSEIVKYLVETCQVDTEAKTNVGATALHFASHHGHSEIVKCLVETCQVDTEAKTNVGWTALHFASHRGHSEIVKYLVETCQVNTEAKTNAGSTALHFASHRGHSEIVKYLIETCQVDTVGISAWHLAIKNRFVAAIRFLDNKIDDDAFEMDTKKVNEFDAQEAEIRKQDEVIQQLSLQVARLEKARELEQRIRDQSEEIGALKMRLALIENELFQ